MSDDPTLEDFIAWLGDPDPDVRRNAAWTLGRQRDTRIIDPLIAALDDEDATVRVRAAESLGVIKDPRIVEPLLETLTDEEPQARAKAIGSLGRQGDLRAIPAALDLLHDSDPVVRSSAAQVFMLLPEKDGIVGLVRTLLDDDDYEVRYYSAKSLEQIGGAATVDALLEAMQGEVSEGGKMYIAEILASLYDKRAIDPLRAWVDDEDHGVRETVKWALGRLGAD